jgi:mannose-6-phosphate isomerase-like protein (cupin superfamily)
MDARSGWDSLASVFVADLAGRRLGAAENDFVVVRWTAEVGEHWIAQLHVHHADDEVWYVLSGALEFRLGDDYVVGGPGAAVLAEKGVPHTYRNAGDVPAEYLLVMPPRIASLIESVHQPGADAAAVFAAHDSSLL